MACGLQEHLNNGINFHNIKTYVDLKNVHIMLYILLSI